MESISKLLDIIVPRFITEKVALDIDEKGTWFVVCTEKDLRPDDVYECIGESRGFNLFGFVLFPKVKLPEGY